MLAVMVDGAEVVPGWCRNPASIVALPQGSTWLLRSGGDVAG
jgi:hypothetical protein